MCGWFKVDFTILFPNIKNLASVKVISLSKKIHLTYCVFLGVDY